MPENSSCFVFSANHLNTTLGKSDQMVYNNGTCICMFAT